jgi:hypothetical protein
MNSSVLIERENTYINDRKIISISSNDRDVKKFPHSNEFEIVLPENLDYVTSIRLVNASIPINDYVFSERNQNTKLWFRSADTSGELINASYKEIQIEGGTFETPNNIGSQLADAMIGEGISFTSNKKITYNNPLHKLTMHPIDKFVEFSFEKGNNYITDCRDKTSNAFDQDIFWGLGYYLGFKKNKTYVIEPNTTYQFPNQLVLTKDTDIFVELENYNNMDEIVPFLNGNKCHGNVNSAFSKIPISNSIFGTFLNADVDNMIHGVTAFNEPLRQLSKLKIKFRYHDGRLVNFGSAPVSLTLEVSRLGDKLLPNQLVRNLY